MEETRQRKVVSGVLERPVSHCCVLETSKLMSSCQEPASIAPHCDLLLVILFPRYELVIMDSVFQSLNLFVIFLHA